MITDQYRIPHCPYCNSTIVSKYGTRRRTPRDVWIKDVTMQRWKCIMCNKTFTQRPEGVTRKLSSDFIVAVSLFLYIFDFLMKISQRL